MVGRMLGKNLSTLMATLVWCVSVVPLVFLAMRKAVNLENKV